MKWVFAELQKLVVVALLLSMLFAVMLYEYALIVIHLLADACVIMLFAPFGYRHIQPRRSP